MVPENLLYTREHEWIKVDGNIATVGITHHAQEQLGDIVFVELPEVGNQLSQMDEFGVIESVKTASDMFAPISGEVTELNSYLQQEIDGNDNADFHPEYINKDPYGKGWIIKVRIQDEGELKNLLSSDEYRKIL